jgi:hypothetical protein
MVAVRPAHKSRRICAFDGRGAIHQRTRAAEIPGQTDGVKAQFQRASTSRWNSALEFETIVFSSTFAVVAY